MSSAKSTMDDLLSGLEAEVSNKPRAKKTKTNLNQILAPGVQIKIDDLDREFVKANLRRNNSDGIRSKDELKTKKIILREL